MQETKLQEIIDLCTKLRTEKWVHRKGHEAHKLTLHQWFNFLHDEVSELYAASTPQLRGGEMRPHGHEAIVDEFGDVIGAIAFIAMMTKVSAAEIIEAAEQKIRLRWHVPFHLSNDKLI